MINVLVSYTVKPEYVAENRHNIQKFLEDFKKLDQSKFEYKVYLKEDGVTFCIILTTKMKRYNMKF